MSKVFVEYAIKPAFRDSFLIYMQEWQRREGRFELLEGTDQEGLFVEIWKEVTYEEYLAFETGTLARNRRMLHSKPYGKSGLKAACSKLHMWHFTEVTST